MAWTTSYDILAVRTAALLEWAKYFCFNNLEGNLDKFYMISTDIIGSRSPDPRLGASRYHRENTKKASAIKNKRTRAMRRLAGGPDSSVLITTEKALIAAPRHRPMVTCLSGCQTLAWHAFDRGWPVITRPTPIHLIINGDRARLNGF